MLYALGRWARGERGDIPFRDVDHDLTPLVKEFSPPRQSYHPEYPFWRLQNDGVWGAHADVPLKARKGNTDPPKGELLAHDARGAFSPEVQAALRADPAMAGAIAARLLENHFPESLHPDILAAVGLDLGAPKAGARKRDPAFRQRVLTAYEYRCAVCGFDVRLGTQPIALDAAHIRWHQAGGPDKESNGLALCVLHHKTFDLGAFTLGPEGCCSSPTRPTAPPASRRPCCATTAGKPGCPSDRSSSRRPPSSTGTAARCSKGRRGTSRSASLECLGPTT